MSWIEHNLRFTRLAEKSLRDLAKKLGKTHFSRLREAIEDLRLDPESKTQELWGALSEYRSLHWARCRIIIKIVDASITVYVVAAGWHSSGTRDDVYQQALRALEAGELDPGDTGNEDEEESRQS